MAMVCVIVSEDPDWLSRYWRVHKVYRLKVLGWDLGFKVKAEGLGGGTIRLSRFTVEQPGPMDPWMAWAQALGSLHQKTECPKILIIPRNPLSRRRDVGSTSALIWLGSPQVR